MPESHRLRRRLRRRSDLIGYVPFASVGDGAEWLGGLDSHQHDKIQSLVSYC